MQQEVEKMENKPGVMLYYETLQAITELDAEDAKVILSAILCYSRDGVTPELQGHLAAIWHLIHHGIDRDGKRYEEKRLRGLWLTYRRKCKAEGETGLEYDEWLLSEQPVNALLPSIERAVNVPSPSSTSTLSPTSSLSPSSTKSNKKNISSKVDEHFEQFWKAYPKKVGKGAARKAWGKIRPTESLTEKIIRAVETAKGSSQWQLDHGQYIPHPATWLNQERWEDELSPAEAVPAKFEYSYGGLEDSL